MDSSFIADCLRFGRINKDVYIADYRYKAFQNITQIRYYTIGNLTKENQRFMNVLFKNYSTITQENIFSNTFSTTTLAVYDELKSAEDLTYMNLQELIEFITPKGKNRFHNSDSIVKAIQKTTRSSYRLPKTVNDFVNQVLSMSITSMNALESQIKEFDKTNAAQMKLSQSVLISIHGIGPVYSTGIMAEIENINHFESPLNLLSMQAMPALSISSETLKLKQQELIRFGNHF